MRQEDKPIVFAATSAHLLTHAYMMIFPTVLILMRNDPLLHMKGYFHLGVIGTLCYALFGIGAIPAGLLADKHGSKKMLTICVFGMALSSLGAGLSSSIIPLVFSMGFLGAAASMYHPSGLSFISRNVEKKGKSMGYHGVGGNIGLAIGPLVSGVVASAWGWRMAFIVFAALGMLLGFAILRLRVADTITPQKQGDTPKVQARVPLGAMILFLVYSTSILYGLCYRGSMMYFPKHFAHHIEFAVNDVAKAGFLVSIVILAGTLGQMLGGTLCDKLKRPEFAYLLVFVFTTPLFFAIWLFKDWALFRVSLVFAPFFFAWQPIQNTLIATYAARAFHGLSYGVNFLLIMGVGSIAASIGGFITDVMGVAQVFMVLGVISLLSLALVYSFLRKLPIRAQS
jgi:MFS family permease